jgi:hypothetical protein
MVAFGPANLGVGRRHFVAGLGAVHTDAPGVFGLTKCRSTPNSVETFRLCLVSMK